VTREIFASPQPDPGAIINRVDSNDRVRMLERNPARRPCNCRRRRARRRTVRYPAPAHGIEFVDEDQARFDLASLLKQIAYASGANADEHLHKI
jgi:hypothetical protein